MDSGSGFIYKNIEKIFRNITNQVKNISLVLLRFYAKINKIAHIFFTKVVLRNWVVGLDPWKTAHIIFRSRDLQMLFKIDVLKNFANFTGKHLCWSLILKRYQKETPIQMFSCEICEIFKNTFFYRTLQVATSAYSCYIL